MRQTFIATVIATASVCLLGSLSHGAAQAQIIPDATWGAENSIVTPNATVQGQPATLIQGGAVRSTNLFHSLQTLNVSDGQRVYFANPAGIQTIFSRVTGNSASNILGTLGVDGAANLFLINPSGIIFGPNARLDVTGSFVATTANRIQFGNQGFFAAADPQAPPLLTINPSALWFNQVAQPIINRSTADAVGLRTAPGQSLLLVGGQVQLDGGRIIAPGGRVELAGVTEGLVGLQFDNNQWRLTPNEGARGDVTLTNNAQVNVRSSGGGEIRIHARNFTMTGSGTQLLAGIGAGLGSPGTQAGNIEIDATESINIDASLIDNSVLANAVGQGGNINVTVYSFSLFNGARFTTSLAGRGNAGDVIVQAQDEILLDGVGRRGASGFRSSVESSAIGNGGRITVTARSLVAQNGGQLNTTTLRGQGNAGDISVNVQETLSLLAYHPSFVGSGIFSRAGLGSVGNGGDISVTAGSLVIRDGAVLDSRVRGRGDAGKIIVTARDTILLDGISGTSFPVIGGIFSDVDLGVVGNGGDISISTTNLFVKNGASISSGSSGIGNSGNITIIARELASWDGATRGFISLAETAVQGSILLGLRATGNGGDLRVTARNISLTNGARLNASLFNADGRAGNIFIEASDHVTLSGFGRLSGNPSSIGTFASGNTTGDGGNISIVADTLTLTDGGLINAQAINNGKGGTIQVDVNRLQLSEGAQLLTTASGTGVAGNIAVNATEQIAITGRNPMFLVRQQNSTQFSQGRLITPSSGIFASTDVGSTASGGMITVNTGHLLVQDSGQVTVESRGTGAAGEISINARFIQLQDQGRISAETTSSTGGNINLNVQD
jgi:filamentous hemagglutinin family protein